jgi:hypothetical protein
MLVFALGFLANAEKGELPTARFLIGAGGIFTVVSVFADFGSPIGAGMAIVILVSATLTQGDKALKLLATRAGERTPKVTSSPAAPVDRTVNPTPNITQRVNDFEQDNPLGIPTVKTPTGATTILRPPKYPTP